MQEEIIITSLEKGPRGLGFSLFAGQTIHDVSLESSAHEDNSIVTTAYLFMLFSCDIFRLRDYLSEVSKQTVLSKMMEKLKSEIN